MRSKFFIPLLFLRFQAAAQTYVVHSDLLQQIGINSAYQTGLHLVYNNKLSIIKSSKNAVTTATAIIADVQQRVFSSLTNVSSAQKNVQTIKYIGQYSANVLNNMSQAVVLSSGKPYLVQIETKYATVIYERLANLTGYVQTFILNSDDSQLINPGDRDRFLFSVYRQIIILDALSADLCSKLKIWTLQDAAFNIVPLNRYLNQDKFIINNIMQNWKF